MDEKVPQDKNETPNLDQQVKERSNELLVEELAFAEALENPSFREAVTKRKAAETEAEISARIGMGSRREQRTQSSDEHPWGIDYLKKQHDLATIMARLEKKKPEKEDEPDKEALAKRSEAIDGAIDDARQLTLELGEVTAHKLKAANVPADIRVVTEHTHEVKKATKENLRLKGKAHAKTPVITHKEKVEGWELPISGQISRRAKAVLCKDGRILVAYGRYEETDEEDQNTLYIQPNTGGEIERPGLLPLVNRPDPKKAPHDTYSGYIDEKIESDIGMANLPINSPVARAHIILHREQSMQEAVVSMLVKHNVSVTNETRELAGLTTPESATEVLPIEDEKNSPQSLEKISDEEKEYRNQGGEYLDLRLTDQNVNALTGRANVMGIPDIVDILGYVKSMKSGDTLKHYFKYMDRDGDEQYTSLDQFVWSHMPPERREKLKQAGFDPDDLETGKHSVFKPYW